MLVVSRRGRRPSYEDEFSPVSVGVGGEERDLLALHGTLCDRDKDIEMIGRHVWPLATDHLVGSVEVDEGHGDPTVLGLMVAVTSTSLRPTGMPRAKSTSSAT